MFPSIRRVYWILLLAMVLAGCSHQQQSHFIKVGQSEASVIDSLLAVGALDIGERFQLMSSSAEQGYPKNHIWEIEEHKLMLVTEFSDDKLAKLSLSKRKTNQFPKNKEHLPEWTKIESIAFHKDKSYSTTDPH